MIHRRVRRASGKLFWEDKYKVKCGLPGVPHTDSSYADLQVTCPKCLEICLQKIETEYHAFLDHMATAINPVTGTAFPSECPPVPSESSEMKAGDTLPEQS